jgi:hypothetical protein
VLAEAGAGGVEDSVNGVTRELSTISPRRLARRGKEADDSYCSTSARPLAMTWSPLEWASYA